MTPRGIPVTVPSSAGRLLLTAAVILLPLAFTTAQTDKPKAAEPAPAAADAGTEGSES